MTIEIGQIIRDHRKRLGLTLQEMQKRTGINNGNLSKIERGQQSLTNDSMRAIAEAFGMSLGDLFSAQQAKDAHLGHNIAAARPMQYRMASEFESPDQIPEDEHVAIGTVSAVVDAARGGVKFVTDEKNVHLFMGAVFRDMNVDPRSLGAFVIEDDMMEPRLFAGDTVVIDLADKEIPATGGVFCVVLDGENIAFRRLMPYPGNGLRIICDNHKYPEAVLDHRQAALITIAGRVKTVRSTSGL